MIVHGCEFCRSFQSINLPLPLLLCPLEFTMTLLSRVLVTPQLQSHPSLHSAISRGTSVRRPVQVNATLVNGGSNSSVAKAIQAVEPLKSNSDQGKCFEYLRICLSLPVIMYQPAGANIYAQFFCDCF